MPTETASGRSFVATKDDGSKLHLTIRKAHRRERQLADYQYSKVFNEAIRFNLPTRPQMLKQLRKNEVWTAEQEAELEKLRIAAAEAEDEYQKAETDVKDRVKEARDQALDAFNEKRSEIESLLSHTADAKADLSTRNFLIACTVAYDASPSHGEKAGKRVWDSLEALLDEEDASLLQRCVYEYVMLQNDLPSNWVDETADREHDGQAEESGQKDAKADTSTT